MNNEAATTQRVNISKPRIAYIDIAKGFAMLCIIAGHFGIVTANSFVYTFHVPLFFLTSGYFLSTKLNIAPFIKQKARQLLLPYYVTGLVFIPFATVIQTALKGDEFDAGANALSILGAILYGAGSKSAEIPFEIRQIGLLWFLWALFIAFIIVRLALKTKYPLLVTCVTAYAGWQTASIIWLPLSIQAGCIASFFVYLGYLARKRNVLSRRPSPLLIAGLLILWAICIYGGITLSIARGSLTLLGVINSAGASYLIVLGCKFLENHIRLLARFLNFFGQATLVVMCFHAISDFTFHTMMLFDFLGAYGIPHSICSVVVITVNVLWPLAGVLLTMHCPPLKRLFSLRPISPLPPKASQQNSRKK